MNKDNCICQSGKPFEKCCDRFLNQGLFARTPVQLMRSRYSAFALSGYGEYLLATWAVESIGSMSAAELSMKTVDWQGLEIVGKSQKGDLGFVEFKASFLDSEGELLVHHEKSEFVRRDGRWLYLTGEVA